jgi:signal transduction histidine kinase
VSVGVEPGGKALVTVADMGPGIADDEKSRVFERFYQTETGRATRSHGVGLGLAICRHIVAEHGGTIRVLDNAPRGSVFCVTLPGVLAEPDSPVPIDSWSDMEVVA